MAHGSSSSSQGATSAGWSRRLGWFDFGDRELVGGMALEFHLEVARRYGVEPWGVLGQTARCRGDPEGLAAGRRN
jgi:hypothetical protein